MSNNIDFDSIRRQIDIVNVISSYIPLSPTGRNFKGICPFHNDSNPSMMVSPDKQIYKCFSCGASGNVFTFIMNYEKVSFIEAVRKACNIQGINIPEVENAREVKKVDNKDQRQIKLMDDLTEFYHYQLLINSQSEANKYLESRFLSKEIVDEFRIGFCPNDGLASVKYLQNKGYTPLEIIECGVGIETSDGRILDRLRGRLVFPLWDSYGRVVAFSGRRINDQLEQKYLNTPETNLFHKSDVLYNYHRAEKVAHQQGYVYIVEGFMDAISLNRAGVKSVVATMGTAFTKEHIKMLSSLRVELRLLFDCDSAGQKAAFKTLELLQDSNLKVKVVKKWEKGKDADEVLNTLGKETLIDYINNCYSPLEFKFEYLRNYYDVNNYDERKKLAVHGSSFIAKAKLDDLDTEHYVKLLSEISGFSKELINKNVLGYKEKLQENVVQNRPTYIEEKIKTRNQMKYLNRYQEATERLIKRMIDDPLVTIPAYDDSDIFTDNDDYQQIIQCIISKFYVSGNVEIADLYNDLNPELQNLLSSIYEKEYLGEQSLSSLFTILKEDYLDHLKVKELEEKGYETSDKKEQWEIAKQLIELKKQQDSLRRKKK